MLHCNPPRSKNTKTDPCRCKHLHIAGVARLFWCVWVLCVIAAFLCELNRISVDGREFEITIREATTGFGNDAGDFPTEHSKPAR